MGVSIVTSTPDPAERRRCGRSRSAETGTKTTTAFQQDEGLAKDLASYGGKGLCQLKPAHGTRLTADGTTTTATAEGAMLAWTHRAGRKGHRGTIRARFGPGRTERQQSVDGGRAALQRRRIVAAARRERAAAAARRQSHDLGRRALDRQPRASHAGAESRGRAREAERARRTCGADARNRGAPRNRKHPRAKTAWRRRNERGAVKQLRGRARSHDD